MDSKTIALVADARKCSNNAAKRFIRQRRKGKKESTLPQRGAPVAGVGSKAARSRKKNGGGA